MEIVLFVSPEPLVVEFNARLDTFAKNVSLNPNILPAEIIKSKDKEKWPEYCFMPSLRDEETDRVLVFKNSDLQKLVAIKTEELLNKDFPEFRFKKGKKIFVFHPQEWEIIGLSKDFSYGQGEIKIALSEDVVFEYDFPEIKKEILFKKVEWAKQELEKFPEIKETRFDLYPDFWPQTPFFSDRINFSVQLLNN
jgi:hypothetical protein